MTNDGQLDAVLAHSLLGTVAAVKGALDTVLTHNLDESTRQSLLMMAQRRLEHLAEQLRHVALGLPDPGEFSLSKKSGRAVTVDGVTDADPIG